MPPFLDQALNQSIRHLQMQLEIFFWVKSMLKELEISHTQTPCNSCANLGATDLFANLVFHSWTKHIETDYHFVRERVASKELEIQFVHSKDRVADGFTKALSTRPFE